MFKRKTNAQIPFREAISLFLSSVKRVWQLDKGYVILTCCVFLLGTIPDLIGVFVTAIFNQRLIMGAEKYASYLHAYCPLLIAFFATVLYSIFFSVWRWTETKAQDKITAFLLRESVRKAAAVDYASYDDPEFYNKIQKGWAQDGRELVNSATTLVNIVSYMTGLLAYISVFAYVDWKLMVAITLLRICLNPFINKTYQLEYHLNNQLAQFRREEQYYRGFFSNKEMASEGRIFDLYDYAQEHYLKTHKEIYRATFIHKLKVNGVNLLSNVMYYSPLAFGYIYLSVCVYNGTVSLANMTLAVSMYVGFVDQVYNTVCNLSHYRYVAEGTRYAREFTDMPTTIRTQDDHIKETVSEKRSGHTVEFCNVSFRYPGTDKNVLENVSFRVEGNETVSIIGANGAGKTTLIHLLMRLYDPTEGIIMLDGKDLRDYSVQSLYELYGVLFQDYCEYAVSAGESITLTTNAVMTDWLEDSLKASTAYKFIGTLENGLDTTLSRRFDPNGAELSVGQKQRVALARAYYKNAPIVILDEPSASIDPESESEILAAVDKVKGTKNIWIISHRLSTCVMSDRVLLFKNGALIGNGPHRELLTENEEYKRMFRLQADRYEVS